MFTKLLPNKTMSYIPVSLAVQMLCLNLAFDKGNGSEVIVVNPINTERSWELDTLVDALDALTEEKLEAAHSAPPGYYDNLYGFREGYDPDQFYGGPGLMRDKGYKYDKEYKNGKISFPNEPLFGSGYFSSYYTDQRENKNSYFNDRFPRPEDVNYGIYNKGFHNPGLPNRIHHPYHVTKTPDHYQDFVHKGRSEIPHGFPNYKYSDGLRYDPGGYSRGARLYSNLLIPSNNNMHFIPTPQRTGVYLIPSPQKYYVDNISKNKNSTKVSKSMDISTLVLGLNETFMPKEEIQIENIKKKIK